MLYDVFICHASEDKQAFVRPLAEALRARNVSVWYDEFELKLGQSIRRAIDRGLAQCRFGIVVLSRAFFAKEWPQYELDGLVDREMSSRANLVLPIWHNVTHEDVARYSPALAGRRAARSSSLEQVVQEIYNVVHPSRSPLLVARDALLEWGVDPPVITDPRWLEVVEASNRIPGYGISIPSESTWTWWCFPLPKKGGSPEEWGERLAWSYMQLRWTETAGRERITPLTEPTRVHDFILNSPGLLETCELFLELAIEYAPQLTIVGFEGPLASAIEDAYHVPSAPPAAGATSCAAAWALRTPGFGGHDALTGASEYFYGGFSGPRVNPFELADNLIWLLSDSSAWLPSHIRTYLTVGIAAHPALPWNTYALDRGDWPECGALSNAISAAVRRKKKFVWTDAMKSDLRARVTKSFDELGLSGDPDAVVRAYIDHKLAEINVQQQREFKARQRSR